MSVSAKDRATVRLAYQIHTTQRGLARYISRFAPGLGLSFSEALRIATPALTAEAFLRIYTEEEMWADCHNDCEVA